MLHGLRRRRFGATAARRRCVRRSRRAIMRGEARIEAGDRQRLLCAPWLSFRTPAHPLANGRCARLRLLSQDALAGRRGRSGSRRAPTPAATRGFRAMIDAGGLEEVRALLSRKLDPQTPIMKAMGVREIARYLNGEITLAASRSSRVSRRPATTPNANSPGFRNQTPAWIRLAGVEQGAVQRLLSQVQA